MHCLSPKGGAFTHGSAVKNPPAMQETWVHTWMGKMPWRRAGTTHSSLLTWRIPRTEKPGGLSPQGLKESDTAEVTQHPRTHNLKGRLLGRGWGCEFVQGLCSEYLARTECHQMSSNIHIADDCSWTLALQALLSVSSPGKNTGVGCHFLLQRMLPTQGWSLGLLQPLTVQREQDENQNLSNQNQDAEFPAVSNTLNLKVCGQERQNALKVQSSITEQVLRVNLELRSIKLINDTQPHI